jgi:aryl-alcohol dehydrogenase-like predicted oxidoreductase
MPQLPTRKIGNTEVTAIGWGGMGLSIAYGPPLPDEERFKVRSDTICFPIELSHSIFFCSAQILDAVYESGCRNWDTADVYADNEDIIGEW